MWRYVEAYLLPLAFLVAGCTIVGEPEPGPTDPFQPHDPYNPTDPSEPSNPIPKDVTYSARVITQETNGNKALETGESTEADLKDFVMKPLCSENMSVTWTVCLVEKGNDGKEKITIDLNGKEVCAAFKTRFTCSSSVLIKGPQECVSGYCNYIISLSDPMVCGWKITEFSAHNATGSLIETLTAQDLSAFGYELLPVGAP